MDYEYESVGVTTLKDMDKYPVLEENSPEPIWDMWKKASKIYGLEGKDEDARLIYLCYTDSINDREHMDMYPDLFLYEVMKA